MPGYSTESTRSTVARLVIEVEYRVGPSINYLKEVIKGLNDDGDVVKADFEIITRDVQDLTKALK